MPTPSVTGSVQEVNSSSASSSTSVTIPSDSDLLLVFAVWYRFAGDNDFSSMTYGGESLSEVYKQDMGTNHGASAIWKLDNPPTGSQTFAWSLTGGTDEGIIFGLVGIADVDTTGGSITGSNGASSESGDDSVTTPSFNTSTDDLVIGGQYGYTGAANDMGVSGQTEIFDSGTYNSARLAIGTKAGVSGTTTMSGDADYPSLAACSVAYGTGAGGGGDPEAALIGGKLIRGGLLTGRRLV